MGSIDRLSVALRTPKIALTHRKNIACKTALFSRFLEAIAALALAQETLAEIAKSYAVALIRNPNRRLDKKLPQTSRGNGV